jgi:2-furoyl-CoA dehydrogenase large subunit
MRRVEDRRFLTGHGRYVDDLAFPRMLHVALLRSPHAHARVRAIDTSKAGRVAGVAAIVTGADLVRDTLPLGTQNSAVRVREYAMAVDKVRYVGHVVAAVVADSRHVAEDALELIEVDYEELPAVVDPERAMQPGATLLWEDQASNVLWQDRMEFGSMAAALAEADHVVRRRLRLHRYSSTPLETFGAIADADPVTGRLTVWASNQFPGLVHPLIARALQIPANQVRLVIPDVGGAFGVKVAVQYMVLIAYLARKLRRPVKYVEDRRESLLALGQSCNGIFDYEAAVKNDGTLLGLQVRVIDDEGGGIGMATLYTLLKLANIVGCYRFRNLVFEGYSVVTNKCPAGANRGVGKPGAAFIIERVMTTIARELGLDPVEVRLKNYIQPDEFPYETPSGNVYDSADYPETLRRALELSSYQNWRAKQTRLRRDGRYIGIGVATAVEPSLSNLAYVTQVGEDARQSGAQEAAMVRMNADGSVSVATGGVSTGQGHETAIVQIVADELGIEPRDVYVEPGFDSAVNPWTAYSGSIANKFNAVDVGAVLASARALRSTLVRVAAASLEVAEDDLELRDRSIRVRGTGRTLALADVAGRIYRNPLSLPSGVEPKLEATSVYSFPYADLPGADRRVKTQLTFSNAAHIAVVEVSRRTGQVHVLDYTVVHDCGRVINPLIVAGQVHGATVHGIAAALLEEFVYDDSGQLLTSSFMDYLKPTAADVPDIRLGHLETFSPFTPLGTKGCGEGGAVTSPAAIANAVEDALQPFGLEINQLPIVPYRLLASLEGTTPTPPE